MAKKPIYGQRLLKPGQTLAGTFKAKWHTQFVDIEGYVRQADETLKVLEQEQIGRIRDFLNRAQVDVERELRRKYPQALEDMKEERKRGRAFAEARANVLKEQMRGYIEAFEMIEGKETATALRNHFSKVGLAAADSALQISKAYADYFEPGDLAGLSQAMLNSVVDVASLQAIAANSGARLKNHAETAVRKMQDVVASTLMRGESVTTATRELRQETNLLRYQAERIIRTETAFASDETRTAAFASQGIEYVQRIATMDERTCEFCAARAGNVYRLEDAPAPLHPNDRCMNVPWKQEWQDLGLIDDDWLLAEKERLQKDIPEDKRVTHEAKAPFEKMNKLDVPKPVYVPGQGPTDYGKTVIKPPKPPKTPVGAPAPKSKPKAAPKAPAAPKKPTTKPPVLKAPAPFNPADHHDAIVEMRELSHKIRNEITAEERLAISAYTGDHYKPINRHLRAGKSLDWDPSLGPEDPVSRIRSINKAFESEGAVAPVDTFLYRGYTVPAGSISASAEKLVGTVIHDPAFISTSPVEHIARTFLHSSFDIADREDVEHVGIFLKVQARKGQTRMLPLETMSSVSSEREVLLPSGSRLQVIEAKQVSNAPQKIYELTVEVVQ